MVAASLLRRFAWRGQAGLGAAAMRVAAVLVVLLGVTASAWIARAWDATVTRQQDERLDRGAASRTTTIVNALRQYETALHAERSLWLASTFVSRQEFSVFADSLNLRERYPGLQGIGWRSFVPDQQARDFVARARKDGPSDFTIRPAGRRPVYYVTLYNEPARLFGATWGLDARATPSVLAALEQARDTGKTVMSGQTTLWPDLGSQAERPVAYELFVPVYGDGEPTETTAQRRAAHVGWASGIFNASDFLQAALRSTQPSTGVELYDPAAGSAAPIATFPGGGFRAGGPHLRSDSFTFGGRTFGLRYTPLPGNPTLTERTIPAPLVVTTGIAVSLLLGALLWLLAQVSTLYQRVGRMARTDPLTGVLNRRVWDQELPRELARAARSGQPPSASPSGSATRPSTTWSGAPTRPCTPPRPAAATAAAPVPPGSVPRSCRATISRGSRGLPRESPDAADPGVEAVLHLPQALHQALQHAHRHLRVLEQEGLQVVRGDPQGLDVFDGLDRRLAPLAGQHRHLAEEGALLQPVEPPAHVHLGGAGHDDVHPVARVSPFDDGLARVERDPMSALEDLLAVLAIKAREQRGALQGRDPDRHVVHGIPPPPSGAG
jgi:CHASE1-domain containing sensor protein